MEKDNLIKQAEVTSDQHQASGIAINPPIFQLQVNPTNNTPAKLKKEEEVQEKSIEDFSSLSYDTGDADPPGDKNNLNQLSQAKPPVFQLKSSSSSGMPDETLNKMSSSFGTDFSDVNIHSDSKSATDAGALAYTQGNDIHFAPGQYDPGSQSGQELLGHELSHVQQQREGRVQANNEVNGMPLNDDKGLEAEADEGGRMAVQRATATDSVPNTEQTIASKLPIQRTLNADQLNRTLNILHGQSAVTASRGGAGETTNINQSDAVRVLREQNQNIDQIKTAFDERYHQPLRDYIRFHYTDDYRVRATALLYEPTYLAPWTQIALCLIPQFTRDVNFFNIMSNLTSSQRETLRSRYNEYFSELGNGSLDADIADDFEGQDEMRARILIYRQLTDSDNLYLATAGQVGTDVNTIISILTRKWEEGVTSFTQLWHQWNPNDSLPDVVNSGNIATNYFNTLPLGGETGFILLANRGRSFMYTILSELSGGAHSRVQAIFLEYLNQMNHSRGAETAPSGWAFSFEEQSRLRVARTDLEAGESGIDDSAEIAAAIGHIIAIYLDRIHRLEAGQASQADIAAAREDMESTRTRLQRNHLDTALGNPDADGNLNLYELNPGDRLWLQRNNLEEYKRIILDYFVRNDLETLKESCRTPHVEYGVRTAHQIAIDNVLWERAESNSTVRAGFRLGEQTDLSNNDVYYSHFCQVGPVTARHGKGLLDDYLRDVSYASLATMNDFLLHPHWDQALLNNILDLFPNSGDPTLSAKQNFVLHLRSLHFDDLPNFPRIRDVFDPPHSAADGLARARRDAAHDEATAGILGNVATSISDAVTGEDARDTLGASIDRLQIFAQQSNTSDEMCQLFRDFYGPTLDLSNMEYGVFQQNLQALQNGRSAVAQAVSAVVSTAIEAILTPFISPVGAALIGQICGILMNEMMDAQHTEVFSTESLQQTVLGAASAGAGVLLEDGSIVARLINDFSGNSAVRGLIREGAQSSISSAAALITDGLRGQLTEEAILAELQNAVASSAAGGVLGHNIHAPENRQFIDQLREEAIQNVTASLAQQQAGILVNLATTGQIDDNYLDQTAQTIAVGLRDGLITAASTHSSEAVRDSYRASRERSRTRREAASATHPSTADVAGTEPSVRILPPPIVVGTDQPSVAVLPPPISIGSPTHPSDSQPSERPERAPILPPPSDQSLEPVIIPPQGRVPVIDDSSDNSLTTPESESETRITGEWESPTDRLTEIGTEQSRDTLIDDIHPSAEEGSEVQVGSDQSAARAPQSTAGTSAASVPVIPHCHVSLLSKSSRMTDVEYQIFVRQEFNSRILQDPSREVGLYENLLTGEWIIIQGDHASVNLPRPGTSVFDSQSDVANIIDESALGSNWRSASHSHPSAGSEGVSPVNRYPSSNDVGIQIVACARNNNQPQHSEIRYVDGNGNIQRTEFGVDLSRSNPIWIAYTDPATGAVIHEDFPDLTAYHFYMDHTFNTSMGAPGPHLEEFLLRRPEPRILSGAAFDGQDNFDGLGSGDLRADRQIGDEVGRMDGLTPTRDSSREDTLIVPRAPHHDASDDSLDSTIDETEPEVRILPPPLTVGTTIPPVPVLPPPVPIGTPPSTSAESARPNGLDQTLGGGVRFGVTSR